MANAYFAHTTTATDLEESLREFERAHERRVSVLQAGDHDHRAVAEAMRHESDAICRHAAVLRANAVRLAKSQ